MTLPLMRARMAWVAVVTALYVGVTAAAGPGNELRRGTAGEPDSLDPQRAVSAPALIVLNDLFEGLMTLDARGKPVPGAAQSFTLSADGRVYTFKLRADLRWSDGRLLTADDFLYSFRRLADPKTGSAGLAAYTDLIKNGGAVLAGALPPAALGVSAPDAATVRVELTDPAPYALTVLALPPFAPLPRHQIERFGSAWTRPENLISNGAYRLTEWTPNSHVRVARNPHFHAAEHVSIDSVVYRPIADLNAGLRLVQTGELDTLTNFPPERLDFLQREMPRTLHLAPSLGLVLYVFNHRLPKFQDPRIRRALSISIDREALTSKIIRTGDSPAYGIVPGGLPNYFPPLAAASGIRGAQARKRARELLAAAGYSSSKPLEVELLYHTSDEHKKIAVAVASMWQAIGVRTVLRNAERQVAEVAARNGNYEITRAAWFSPYDDPVGLLGFLRGNSPQNISAYASAAVDELLSRAQRTADLRVRGKLLRQAEQQIVADDAVIPLYFMVSRRLVATRVRGWRDDNLTAFYGARYLSLLK
ncbi:MAG TPA: peptide ABC transporter substrate-binding protein [Steroidobacteraceae bacterium]|nr:peptide ABC transporter substrate-binding protein [Steroidobacteraceae bacterium]HRX89184.1 peptide ABC transporter substrate-binding protein [Steroidobacteraceae bacterium]